MKPWSIRRIAKVAAVALAFYGVLTAVLVLCIPKNRDSGTGRAMPSGSTGGDLFSDMRKAESRAGTSRAFHEAYNQPISERAAVQSSGR